MKLWQSLWTFPSFEKRYIDSTNNASEMKIKSYFSSPPQPNMTDTFLLWHRSSEIPEIISMKKKVVKNKFPIIKLNEKSEQKILEAFPQRNMRRINFIDGERCSMNFNETRWTESLEGKGCVDMHE